MLTITDLRRHVCTKKDPWREDMGKRGIHPEAIEGEQENSNFGGDMINWNCPMCGANWKQELPQ